MESNESKSDDNEMQSVPSSQTNIKETQKEVDEIFKQVLLAKFKLATLKRKRRLLLEELHRQCLEGELEPKKRLKPFFDKCKKNKINVVQPS
eukprot:scaffold233_cov174-Ochromonas_danica.AAC.15